MRNQIGHVFNCIITELLYCIETVVLQICLQGAILSFIGFLKYKFGWWIPANPWPSNRKYSNLTYQGSPMMWTRRQIFRSDLHSTFNWRLKHSKTNTIGLTYQGLISSHIAKFMGPTWGQPGSYRPQMGPMLAPWTLLSGMQYIFAKR